MCVLSCFSCVPFFVTLWSVAKAPLSMQEEARVLERVAVESSENLPNPGLQPASLSLLHWQAGSLPLVPLGKPLYLIIWLKNKKIVPPKLHVKLAFQEDK